MSGAGKRPSRGPSAAGRRTSSTRAGQSGARRQKDAGRSTARPDTRRSTATGRRTVSERGEQQPELSAPAVRRRFSSRAAVLLTVICLIVISLAYPLREYVAQRAQIKELEEQKRSQQREIAKLRAEENRLRDPAYIEQQARKRLHYAKPGELTYVVVDYGKPRKDVKQAQRARASWSQRVWGSVRVADRPNG